MVDLLGRLPNRGLQGSHSGQGRWLVRIIVPRVRVHVGHGGLSSLIFSMFQGKTPVLTPHLSRYSDSETAYGRLGLVHSVLRVHLQYQLCPIIIHGTHSLVTSSWHCLPKVDHLIAMASVFVIESDQHESSLPVSYCQYLL